MASAFAKLVRATLAQRETKGSRLCACGTVVFGERGRLAIPDQCATCALKESIQAAATFDALAVSFVEKVNHIERSA